MTLRSLLLLLCAYQAPAQFLAPEQTRAEFLRLASELPFLDLSATLRDYPDYDSMASATDPRHSMAVLLDLLSHENPNVRTLAAVALFDREDPTVLPALVRLAADPTPTFDDLPLPLATAYPPPMGAMRPLRKQTVGHVASEMVRFYMERSGFYYGIQHPSQPGFKEYWETRRNRSHCAGWFAVQLNRASHGTSPTMLQSVPRIRQLRARIEQLPASERTWVLLWLNGEPGSDALASQGELIDTARQLGPDQLLLMLRHRMPSADPDLQPRENNNWPYKRMTLFVLQHADQLLRPTDSAALLECETWQRNYTANRLSDPTITAWWSVAAARLQPADAARILHAAMTRFTASFEGRERSTIAATLCQLVGAPELSFLLDWFFNEKPEHGAFPNCLASFIEAVANGRDGRQIIARIIGDRRLEDLDWQSLERLIRSVNRWMKTPVVTEEEIAKAWHPYGQGHFHWSQAEAERLYPKETAELRKHLEEWRRRLIASVPSWLPSR